VSGIVDGLRGAAAQALFPAEGELRVGGLEAPVDVHRDRWGAAYIRAASRDDLWFAQGLVTAGERLFQLDLALRQANGRLSEVFAERTLADDRFARTIGLHLAGERIAAEWTGVSASMMERFVAGVHAWIELMPVPPIEYTLLDFSPELPRDPAAWAACWSEFAWSLSGNWDRELQRVALAEALGADAAATLLPSTEPIDPALAAGGLAGMLLRDLPPRPAGRGSNEWALAGGRTDTGKPLLANDPHLTALQPAPWLEMHLSAPGYRARGVAAPFVPGIVLGTTAHHAWGATNVGGDVSDLYLEELSPDGGAARYLDGWEPLTLRSEAIAVRGSSTPHVLEVRETRHGPILDSYPVGELDPQYRPLDATYALRWVGAEHGAQPDLALRFANAGSFEEFREAVWGLECPGQNLVYADVDGHIGYQCTGRYPIRRAGDGTQPAPGWTDSHEWGGWVPFEELPWSKDPELGYLVTANNRMHDESYPHVIGNDFHAPHRATRITERIEEIERHTVDTTRAIQLDTVSLAARRVLGLLRRQGEHGFDTWDGDMRADSTEAALFNRWVAEVARRVVPRDDVRETYMASREAFLCDALPRLLEAGALSPELLADAMSAAVANGPASWGEMHRVVFAHPLARLPGLEELFVAAEVDLGGDEQTVAQAGFDHRHGFAVAVVASWRAVYDLADIDRSVGVLPTGNSGNPASPHWNDQTSMWSAGDHHELPFTDAAVTAAAVSTLRVWPTGRRATL
jgi:penicillin amidase